MKKTTTTLLFSFLLFFAFSLHAQQWVKHGVGISSNQGICAIDLSAPSDNVAWAIFGQFAAGTCGGVVPYYAKTVSGISWSGGVMAIPITQTPVCISAIDANTAWVATCNPGTQETGRVYKTSNGGTSWVLQSTAIFTDAARFIHFYDANEGVVIGDSAIYITSNGGTTWTPNGSLPIPANTFSTRTQFLLNSYEVLGNMIWLGDTYGNFYKSNDRGLTWTLLPGCINPSAIKGIAFKDALNGIAVASVWVSGGGNGPGGYADMSVRTTDGGNTWQSQPIIFSSPNVAAGSAIYDATYIPGTANTYIACSEYDSTWSAYSVISIDGGATWSLIDSTEQHTVCVFTSPTNGYSGGYVKDFSRGIFKWSGSLPTGITEANWNNDVSVYPNPTSDEINIEFPESEKNSEILISLTDINGRAILTQHENLNLSKSTQLNLREFEKGIYILTISSSESRMSKLIIHQ
ncbi:MAG: T9SS type A sorting domain-containing protein [Bacteroidetes bacterium]|nr:T9SS type A sorting domain-containing protein [Bacteroidota bacterium]